MKSITEHDLEILSLRFTLEKQLCSTVSFICYTGIEKANNKPVLLLVHRLLHEPHGAAANRFPARQKKIAEHLTDYRQISFSVLGKGVAYVVLPPFTGKLLSEMKGTGSAAEIYWQGAIDIVAALHKADVILGDITDQSFYFDQNETIKFVGSLGYASLDHALSPHDPLAQFLAPEQFDSDRADKRSDIFALGVLGYRLFTGHYVRDAGGNDPQNNPSKNAPAPTSYDSTIPPWVDAVLGGCLAGDRSQRFSSAVELQSAIVEGRERGLIPGGANPWLSRAVATPLDNILTRDQASKNAQQIEQKQQMPVFIVLLLVTLGIAVFFLFQSYSSSPEKIVIESNELIVTLLDLAPAELTEEINKLHDPELPITAIQEVLTKVSATDNPVVTLLLTSAISGELVQHPTSQKQTQRFAATLYGQYLNRHGLVRTAQIFEDWVSDLFRRNADLMQSESFRNIMQAIDEGREPKSRRDALQKLFEREAELAIRFAAALALDGKQTEEFQPLARIFLQSKEIPNASGRTFEELLLVYPATAATFSEDIKSLTSKLKNNQLSWVLKNIITNRGKILYEVVEEVVKRDIVPPYQKVFLEPMASDQRHSIPEHVRSALLSASLGDLSLATLQSLLTWGGVAFERVFLSFAAIAPEQELATQAVDFLAERIVKTEPAKTLIPWYRKQDKDSRKEISKAVGVLGLIDLAEEDDVSYAFNVMMSHSGGRELYHAGLLSSSNKLQREVVDRIGPIMGADEAIPLLRHEDSYIRAAAVKLLKGNNNITVLNEVARAYEREKDPAVREVYESEHWVAQNR